MVDANANNTNANNANTNNTDPNNANPNNAGNAAANNTEAFRKQCLVFFQEYLRAKSAAQSVGTDVLANFARSNERTISNLYSLKQWADPGLFSTFKDYVDALAWQFGQPEAAVLEYSKHKQLSAWDINGSEMTFSFLSTDDPPIKCSTELRDKIKDDFKKMTGYDLKDEFLHGGPPPTYMTIPEPESRTLRARLMGETIAQNGISDTPIPPNLIKKVGTDPIFRAWDDYQKKLFKATNSVEDMMATACELTMLLPLNYLNEVITGLNGYLKDRLAQTPQGGPRTTPRDTGTPGPGGGGSPGGGGTPSPGGTPPGLTDSPAAGRTFGDLAQAYSWDAGCQRYWTAILLEMHQMEDPKTKALCKLIDEYKLKLSNPEILRDPLQKAIWENRAKLATKQFAEMIPFAVKHARDRGNLQLDQILAATPGMEKAREDLENQINRINVGLTPNGQRVVGETAPNFEELYKKLDGNYPNQKRKNMEQSYELLDEETKNNALVCAVKMIMEKKSGEERKKLFEELMSNTIWTPGDIKAANTFVEKLRIDNHITSPLVSVPVKPYNQEPGGQEMNIDRVAERQIAFIEEELKDEHENNGFPDGMRVHVEDDKKIKIAEMVDNVSGSITLRVEEQGKEPYFITYCKTQQKIALMDREKRTQSLSFDQATPALKGVCNQLAGHYDQIVQGNSPFIDEQNKGIHLADSFSSLLNRDNIRQADEFGKER